MAEADIVKVRKTIKLSEMAGLTNRTVEINDEHQFTVRPLTLREMVVLFTESQEDFLPLYEIGLDLDGLTSEKLLPFLIAAPNLVARVIALSANPVTPDRELQHTHLQEVLDHMPVAVQLIALSEIWKASVPDAKKAQELLSMVAALLKTGREKAGQNAATEPPSSPTPSALP